MVRAVFLNLLDCTWSCGLDTRFVTTFQMIMNTVYKMDSLVLAIFSICWQFSAFVCLFKSMLCEEADVICRFLLSCLATSQSQEFYAVLHCWADSCL